jgi:putative ATP-dependent endonuclease of the OLD family
MQLLEDKTSEAAANQIQVLLTTHSPHLASSASLEAMTLVIGHKTYPLGKSNTQLGADDYGFLRRFLDATKANLFFARGLIIVEGDAENLLLPAIARKLGRPLSKFGVSIVNVGHRGLFRYSRILQRRDGSKVPIPVALIPDRDIPPDAAKALIGDRVTESEWDDAKRAKHLASLKKDEGGAVVAFASEQWTLEFDLARKSALAIIVHQAIKLAKGVAGKTDQEIKDDAEAEVRVWRTLQISDEEIAVLIFDDLYNKRASKAETAQRLAQLIDSLEDDAETFKAKLPGYLSSAIDHATSFGSLPSVAPTPTGVAG